MVNQKQNTFSDLKKITLKILLTFKKPNKRITQKHDKKVEYQIDELPPNLSFLFILNFLKEVIHKYQSILLTNDYGRNQ